jgi:uncharacterized membrane protein YfcA
LFVQQYRENDPIKRKNSETKISIDDKSTLFKHALFGVASGILSALMGVGGAPLTMSYLTLATDLPHHLVQGTMLVAILPAVLTSAFALGAGGHTPFLLTASVCVGSVIGSTAGAYTALKMNEATLRQIYMASLIILGGRSFIAAGFNMKRILLQYIAKK